ncbi:hypothetical protein AB3G45_00735 [Shinella sp. S4-D37]|uniref:hypothetical protein n=1 Tax=Shinella sp. S4-D37 TaxID=3161999 RepID=UPI00346690E3
MLMGDPSQRGELLDLLTEISLHPDEMAAAYKALYGKEIEVEDGLEAAALRSSRHCSKTTLLLLPNSDVLNKSIGDVNAKNPPVGFGTYSDRRDKEKEGWALQMANDVQPADGCAGTPHSWLDGLASLRLGPHTDGEIAFVGQAVSSGTGGVIADAGCRMWASWPNGRRTIRPRGRVRSPRSHRDLACLPPSRVVPVTPGTATILHFPGCDGRTAQHEGYNIGAVAPDALVAAGPA